MSSLAWDRLFKRARWHVNQTQFANEIFSRFAMKQTTSYSTYRGRENTKKKNSRGARISCQQSAPLKEAWTDIDTHHGDGWDARCHGSTNGRIQWSDTRIIAIDVEIRAELHEWHYRLPSCALRGVCDA